jgi:hypothetical protein
MLRLTTILMVAAAFLVAMAAFGGAHATVAPGVHVADGTTPPPDPLPDCWPFCNDFASTNTLTADGTTPPPDPLPDCWPFCNDLNSSTRASIALSNVRTIKNNPPVGTDRLVAVLRPEELAA